MIPKSLHTVTVVTRIARQTLRDTRPGGFIGTPKQLALEALAILGYDLPSANDPVLKACIKSVKEIWS
jgi:hypothetical protein